MARICPKDFMVCCDDLCRGSGTCIRTGDDMMEECPRCHQPISREFNIECSCPPEYEDDDYFAFEED